MRIIVPIKQVPETSNVRMDPDTGTMVRDGVAAVVNPLDLYAIQVAVDLRDRYGTASGDGVSVGGTSNVGPVDQVRAADSGTSAPTPSADASTVTALSMGPQKAMAAIREAVAMGCDDGVLLSDRAFGGADTWATSYTIAQAIRKLGAFDIVICGERATDGDTGQVGPGIAAWLDLPVLSYVSRIVRVDGGSIEVERLVEEGYQIVRSPLPVVLTVVKEIARPELPTLRGKKRARRMEVPVWDRTMIEADESCLGLRGSPTRVVSIRSPKVARQGETFVVSQQGASAAGRGSSSPGRASDDADAAVERLVEFLAERNVPLGVR